MKNFIHILNIFLFAGTALDSCQCFIKVLYEFNGDNDGNMKPSNPQTTKWKFQNRAWTACINNIEFQDELKFPEIEYPGFLKKFNLTMTYTMSNSSEIYLSLGQWTLWIPVHGNTHHISSSQTSLDPNLSMKFISHRFCGSITNIQVTKWYADCTLPPVHKLEAMRLVYGSNIEVKCVEHTLIIEKPVLQCYLGNYEVSGK